MSLEDKTLDRECLIQLAGERAFRRGEEYRSWRRVRGMTEANGSISAIVVGRRSYCVKLCRDGSKLSYVCNCPQGVMGRFCKHCVAVGLGWGEAGSKDGSQAVSAEQEMQLMIDFAAQSAILAETETACLMDFKEVENALFLLLEAGFAAQAAALIENAQVFRFSFPSEAVKRLQDFLLRFHRKALARLNDAPDALAKRLLTWQLRSAAALSETLLDDYAGLLGAEGWMTYCQMVGAEWERLHADGEPHQLSQKERCARLCALMMHIAQKNGDLATLITVKSRHLENASDYVELVRLHERAGDRLKALEWARRSMQELPIQEVSAIYDFLAERYEACENWHQALLVRFAQFKQQPSLAGYQLIKKCAQNLSNWDVWRERMLNVFRPSNVVVDAPRCSANPVRDLSALVSILLWEGNNDQAWQVAQQNDPKQCRDELWLELARRRAKKHPEEALTVYQWLIAQHASRKNRYSYELAIRTLRRMSHLLRKMKRQAEFLPYVEGVCRKHRYQHLFVKMLRLLMARHSRSRSDRKQ